MGNRSEILTERARLANARAGKKTATEPKAKPKKQAKPESLSGNARKAKAR